MDKSEETPHIHKPKFIIIEDEFVKGSAGTWEEGPKEGPYSPFQGLSDVKFSLSLRIISLGLSLLLILSTLVVTIATLFCGLLKLITFGRIKRVDDLFTNCYSLMRKSLVLTIGLFIATFSPSFGFAIIIIYFLMIGEKLNQDLLRRLFSTTFR